MKWRPRLTPRSSVCGLVLLAAMVVAGLSWVSVASLRVEAAQREAAQRADIINKERRALWRLDSSMLTPLGLENNRPYAHYFALHSPTALVFNDSGDNNNDFVRVPSPLLSAEFPDWLALHVQIDPERGWESPQVIPQMLAERLQADPLELSIMNCTTERQQLLEKMKVKLPAPAVLKTLIEQDRMDPDLNPYVVPVPLLDEPGSEKPRGNIGTGEPLGESKDSTPPPTPPELKQTEAFAWKTDHSPAEKRLAAIDTTENAKKEQLKAPSAGVLAPQAAYMEKASNLQKSLETQQSQVTGIGNSQQTNPIANNVAMNGGSYPLVPGIGRGVNRAYNGDESTRDNEARKGVVNQSLGSRGSYEIQTKNGQNVYGNTIGNSTANFANGIIAAPPAAQCETPTLNYYSFNSNGSLQFGSPYSGYQTPMMATVPGILTPIEGIAYSKPGEKVSPELFSQLRQQNIGKQNFELASRKPQAMPLQLPIASERKAGPTLAPVGVHLGPMRPHWLKGEDGSDILCLLRSAQLENKTVYQGIVLDWPKLQASLKDQVADLYPGASFEPVRNPDEPAAERTMTALPVLFVPGEEPTPLGNEWSPLRWGLVIAWAAALLSIVAVAFGGRAILAMSERRVRFASAVTHELRTPLTALQLHLDLLNSGLITDEAKKSEYLATIGAEADRLNRLVENVLAFARLEKKSAQANARSVTGTEILESVQRTWTDRLGREGFELVTISTAPAEAAVRIDARVLEQVLGNLIDNARKYAKDAADHRIWVWVKPAGGKMLALEVEDRGPGVPTNERRSIFKPFQRGTSSVDSGGAGLGLSLAKQWIDLFGGSITCVPAEGGVGCCFRIELPMG